METTQPHDRAFTEMLARMQEMQAALQQQQEEIRALKAQASRPGAVRAFSKHEMTSCRTEPRWPLRGRGKRFGMGLSLALVLLIAPSQSGVTHADGTGNTRYGNNALPLATTGNFNSGFGESALSVNTTGHNNTASGHAALFSNTSGQLNSAFGDGALYSNTTGNYNTATGNGALLSNTTGVGNAASGIDALYNNGVGNENTATGDSALYGNSTGTNNSASGSNALFSNSTGSNNTAVGFGAGNTDTPANANTSGSNNTFIGYNAGPGVPTQLTNATAIGANAVVSMSNAIVLGGIGVNTQRIGVGTTTPHSAFQIAKGFLQIRPVFGPPLPDFCLTDADAGRLVVRTDGNVNLYICTGSGGWIGK